MNAFNIRGKSYDPVNSLLGTLRIIVEEVRAARAGCAEGVAAQQLDNAISIGASVLESVHAIGHTAIEARPAGYLPMRPDGLDFALEVVGDPEASALHDYIKQLEARTEQQHAALESLREQNAFLMTSTREAQRHASRYADELESLRSEVESLQDQIKYHMREQEAAAREMESLRAGRVPEKQSVLEIVGSHQKAAVEFGQDPTEDNHRLLIEARLALLSALTTPPAPAQPVQGVPEGWEIREDDTWIYFKRPDGFCQAVTPNDPHTSHAQTLHMLMRAMLTASPTPQAQQPEAVPSGLHEKDIYDFAGWLTSRPGVMEVGCTSWACPMADAVVEYIKTFPERFAPAQQPAGDVVMDARVIRAGSSALRLVPLILECAVHKQHDTALTLIQTLAKEIGLDAAIDAAMASDSARKAGGE